MFVSKWHRIRKKSEVIPIMMTLFDDEQIMRTYIARERREADLKASIRSVIETYQECGISMSNIILKIAKKFNLSEQDSKAFVEQYWK